MLPTSKGRFLEFALVSALVLALALGLWQLGMAREFIEYNQDEFQHAHIAWLTHKGRLIYRDFFEHHGPLFPFWNAGLWRLSGGKPSLDFLQTLRNWNLVYLTLAATLLFVAARRLAGSAIHGLAVAALFISLGTVSRFGLAVRPDSLGAALIAALCVAMVYARPMLAGVIAGLAIGVHPKFLGVVSALTLAQAGVVWLRRESLRQIGVRFLSGFVLIHAPLLLFFVLRGGGAAFFENAWWTNFELIFDHGGQPAPAPIAYESLNSNNPIFLKLVLASLAFGLASVLRTFRKRDLPESRQWILLSLLALLPLLTVKLWPQFLLTQLPVLCLAPLLVGGRFRQLVPWVLLVVSATQLAETRSWMPVNQSFSNREQHRLSERVVREALHDEQAIYLWPSRCAGYVFLDNASWMWMISPSYGVSGRGGRLNAQSRAEARRLIHEELHGGSRRWIMSDDRELTALGPELQKLLREQFKQDGCVWKRL